MKLTDMIQFAKFAVVGAINTLIDWAVFYVLIYFITPDERLFAKAVSFAFAVINSFVLNSIWTFRDEFYRGIRNKNIKFYSLANYFIRFIIVSLVGFAINYLAFRYVIFNATGWFAQNSNLVGLIAASGSSLVWNFIINKLWTYNKTTKYSEEESVAKAKNFKFDLVAAVIIFISLAISFTLISRDSAIVDETAHIPAGYTYAAYNDYRLNPEHPPLAKYVSGIPLQFLDLKPPKLDTSWQNILQWDSGWFFIFNAGNDPDQVVFWARLPMLLFVLALGILLYKWASEEFGNKTGLFVLFLYSFTPDVLAHGHFVTTDVPAAFGFALAVYTFSKFLDNKNLKYLIIAGVGLGVAQLLKFSAFMLYPILLLSIIVKSWIDSRKTGEKFLTLLWGNFKSYFWISIISLAVVWAMYIPMVWNMSGDVERRVIFNNMPAEGAEAFRNFLGYFADNPILRGLGHYILGLMLVFGRVAGGNSTFIIGNFSDKAISWFFPVAFLIKTPVTILILFVFSLIFTVWKKVDERKGWLLWLIGLPFVIYWMITLKGSLNIGTRHLLPVLPFMYIFIGLAMQKIIESKKLAANLAVIIALFTLAVPVVAAYPKYISYFNAFTFGKDRHELMVDSSLDWGQDLKRLASYVEDRNIKGLKIDYFGGGLPSYYIPDSVEYRSGYGPTTGWLAVSATFYQMSKLHGEKEGKWSYSWLDSYAPVKIIGDSILLYHITPEDLAANPPTSPYPIIKYDTPKQIENNNQL